MAKRFTEKEWKIIYACMQFVKCGEIDGGPLEGETEKEQDENLRVFESALKKIEER